MAQTQNFKLAVLIDADNAQASIIKELLAEVSSYGVATVKRAYGDWTTSNLKGWKETLHKMAILAAINALEGGVDKSNGAYFWDGADIKSNYKHHFKVRRGIKFTDPSHNIYGIQESTKIVIKYKTTKVKNTGTGKVSITRVEVGRYDQQYDSTAAYGGTIFWKFNPQFLDVTHGWEYK